MATKKVNIKKPETIDDASALLARFGELRNKLTIISATAVTAANQVMEKAALAAAPVKAEAAAIGKALIKWAETQRAAGLEGDGKTITLATGSIYWRLGGEALAIMEGFSDEDLIAELRRRRLTDFIRTSEALDKAAIKDQWDRVSQIPGFRKLQAEFVYLKPLTVKEAVEVKTKKVEIVATSGATQTADA